MTFNVPPPPPPDSDPKPQASDEQYAAQVRLGRKLEAEIAALNEQLSAVKAWLKANTVFGWSMPIDGVKATRPAPKRTFSEEMALSRMTDEQKLSCVVTSINPKKVREIANAEGWTEACMVTNPDGDTNVRLG